MTGVTVAAEKFFEALVEELSIPQSRYEQATRSYKSLAEWLHRGNSTVRNYSPEVYVQGSFRLGTATKPVSSEEEYDIDSVCAFTNLSKSQLSQAQLKRQLGIEIEAYRKSKKIEKPMVEGRRCWTLEYSDDAQFHMDILPAIPDGLRQRQLLEARSLNATWADTAIAITDNEEENYYSITDDWPHSNPKGFAEWFRGKMGQQFIQRRNELLNEARKSNPFASIEDVPDYRVRTPLQSAVMILKRHRDIMFMKNPDPKPISIIVTTLAAHAYEGDATIAGALGTILNNMEKHIEVVGSNIMIRNPTDPSENFADKWEDHPDRKTAFFEWLAQAKADFFQAFALTESKDIGALLEKRIGGSIVSSTIGRMQAPSQPNSLLRTATTAGVASSASVSFGNQPRIPKKPPGFA